MNDKQTKRPVFIKAGKLISPSIKNNTVTGDVDFLEAESIDGLDASGNVHRTPDSRQAPVEKAWHKKPLGILSIAVLGILIAGAISSYMDWN